MTLLERAKAAGHRKALESFNLLNKTDKPPPTWAHGRDLPVTIPSMRQESAKHGCRRCQGQGKESCTCRSSSPGSKD